MEYRRITEEEKKWVKKFEKVMKLAPSTLFMFVGGSYGHVWIIPKDEKNERYLDRERMDPNHPDMICIFTNMDCDGGDW